MKRDREESKEAPPPRSLKEIKLDWDKSEVEVKEAEKRTSELRKIARKFESEYNAHPAVIKNREEEERQKQQEDLEKYIPEDLYQRLVVEGDEVNGVLLSFEADDMHDEDGGYCTDYPYCAAHFEFVFSKSGKHVFLSEEWNSSCETFPRKIKGILRPGPACRPLTKLWERALEANKNDVPKALMAMALMGCDLEEDQDRCVWGGVLRNLNVYSE